MAREWPPSDEQLDQWRKVGDPEADQFVDEHFKKDDVRELMGALVKQRSLARTDLAALAVDDDEAAEEALAVLLDAMAEKMPDVTDEDLDTARELFKDYGPEILMILGCYSLPAAYAAKNGVQVLATTKFLELETDRRLAETAQIIMDVMTEGLGPGQGEEKQRSGPGSSTPPSGGCSSRTPTSIRIRSACPSIRKTSPPP
jgi:hypothetical protein